MAQERSRILGVALGAVGTVADVADLAQRGALRVVGGARGTLERWAAPPEHHMEVMARRVARAARDRARK